MTRVFASPCYGLQQLAFAPLSARFHGLRQWPYLFFIVILFISNGPLVDFCKIKTSLQQRNCRSFFFSFSFSKKTTILFLFLIFAFILSIFYFAFWLLSFTSIPIFKRLYLIPHLIFIAVKK